MGSSYWPEYFIVNMKAVNISLHVTIDSLVMSGKNIRFKEVLIMLFLAINLYISIFKVNEDMLRESMTVFLQNMKYFKSQKC